jgi:glucan 1,3-beta-glucosidase
MRPFFAGAVVALFSSLSILEVTAQRWGFPYGDQKVRGVNLGGWLVLEVRDPLQR